MTADTVNSRELALVLVLVAKDTLGACVILKFCPLRVTAIAGLLRVSSLEREAGHLMVKASVVPPSRVVALGARSVPEGLPMWVEIEMATPAAHLDGSIGPPRVAASAVHLSMLPLEGEATHRVVIKAQIMEAALLVTALTGGAPELSPVLIFMTA